ncbi:MAG: DUF779 domain-containing protein [Alphaproteobacteria bacterium]
MKDQTENQIDSETTNRVAITPEAAVMVRKLKAQHGALLFHQSGGCCDGSSPMCYPLGEFRVGAQDILLGEIEGCPFYIGAAQFEHWKHTHLTVDMVPGRGGGFSLEAPEGVRFLTRSRVFSEKEGRLVEELCPLVRGDGVAKRA